MTAPNATLLKLLAACAEGNPDAAAEFAGKLATEIPKSHAPNIVFCPAWQMGNPPADPAYVIEDRKD